MAVKKSQIYSSLWASCDELRGGMDASIYKDYILVLLFVKYVSDKYGSDPYAPIVVPEGGGFADMVLLTGTKEIGEGINTVIAKLAEENGLRGIIDNADFDDDNKLGKGDEKIKRLSNLVTIFNRPDLSFSGNRAGGDDILGDAYEYLMRHFATESGKSKGQFYTPAEVSRIMARVIGVRDATSASQTIYDPTCGSGSLLLRANDEAPLGLSIYGQEKDTTTSGLAVMNMVLHGVTGHVLRTGNTLTTPAFQDNQGKLKTFDFVVANPPFSDKAWLTGITPANDLYSRFALGIPPKKNGDYAYLLHIIASMKSKAKGAVVMPHGVLFRGNGEGAIRKRLIERRYIKGIIGLPANLFFGTGIPACLIVLDKEDAASREGIYMIDASKGFIKNGPKNALREQDVHKIVDCFARFADVEGYARLVLLSEIEHEGFNLNIPRYIDSGAREDLHDIEAHLKGGIPIADIEAMAQYWDVLPTMRAQLFGPGPRPETVSPLIEAHAIKAAIREADDFGAYADGVMATFEGWRAAHRERLAAFGQGDSPKALIHDLSEDLLARFQSVPLIDPYDVYQHLMRYWAETMQDDMIILSVEGWEPAKRIRKLTKEKDEKFAEMPDIKLGSGKGATYLKAELIPPALIVARFLATEAAELTALDTLVESMEVGLDGMAQEHGGENGLLVDACNEKGELVDKLAKARLKEIATDPDYVDEAQTLRMAILAIVDLKNAKEKARDARAALAQATTAQYAKLSDEEAKALLVDDKWVATVTAAIEGEINRVAQSLSARAGMLADRYARRLPDLMCEVEEASARVAANLARMGFAL